MSIPDEVMKLKDGKIIVNKLKDMVATQFVEATANEAGTYVVNQGQVYYLPDGHTANTTWANTTKVGPTNIGAELSSVKSAIQGKQDAPETAGTAGQVLGLDNSLNPVWVNQSGGGSVDPSAIAQAVDDWCDENITNPDSPPLDRSLSSSSSAAPADIAGEMKEVLEDCGFFQESTYTLPTGYQSANYENSSHTTKFKYANSMLEIFKKNNTGSVSNGNLRLTLSNVGLSIGNSVAVDLSESDDIILKYITSINANADKYNLELRFYNSDFTAFATSESFMIPFVSGSNKENELNIATYVTTNSIDITTYPNLIIMGLRWTSHTATEDENATLNVVGFSAQGEPNIIDRVEALENGKVPLAKLDDDVIDYIEFPDAKNISFANEDVLVWYETTGNHTGGAMADFAGANATDLIDIEGIEYFNFNFYGLGDQVASVAYYDSSKAYISGLWYTDIGNQFYQETIEAEDFPEGTKYVRFCTKVGTNTSTVNKIVGTATLHTVKAEVENIDTRVTNLEASVNGDRTIYWAVCGDSITNANHESIESIDESDDYYPIDGYNGVEYARKNYAYYFAKDHHIQWANYGYGGTTLHHCDPKGYPTAYPYPFVDDRIENLKEGIDWDYITIFFGWNDLSYGPTYQRDLWLTETYGSDIGYPVTNEQIGATGFATQAQKDACDAVTGSVGGVTYNDNDEYFFAKFVGTISDNVKTTWMGAWNYALDYLMRKYPTAKIMIVAPYVSNHSQMIRTAVQQIAAKWGVIYFDFEDLPYWYYRTTTNNTPFAPASGNWTTGKGYECPNTINGYNRARYSWDNTHPSNLGYRTLANPFGYKMLNG